ncbi:hypothetical protein PVT68_00765 [Microbulbifer bruguierae]|uniref:Uncharacterized protein n=1 Tax=Microbulbifer bruguierae TaxID=3029061 RepID=A0ABY8NGJ9_9GAMM|nr:hypothetical protein [Microbulbifer bruguierae]WGL16847.1 hypothetical protein PVT68_00765 [Microbulbifer bruguierae]
MSVYLLIKFFHNLCFVYWLGGDLGTFYASRFVAREDLSPQARSTALTIMMGCDQGPRFCMPLILPLGLQLAFLTGQFSVPVWVVVAAWAICLGWFALVAVLHFSHGKGFIPVLTRLDFALRVVLIAGLLGVAAWALLSNAIFSSNWLAIKLAVFALLVFCGLMIRVRLKNFIVAWGTLLQKGADDHTNRTIRGSIAACRPFVYLIWVGLLVNAAYGLHLLN